MSARNSTWKRWSLLLAALLFCLPAHAQEDAFERVGLRIKQTRPGGLVVVDRGAVDGAEKGDRVFFYPLVGPVRSGVVRAADERSAMIELYDKGQPMAPGTRGEILVPRERFAARAAADPGGGDDVAESAGDEATGDGEELVQWTHAPWENEDEDWEPGMSLLAEVDVLRPEERALRWTERVYLISDRTWAGAERSDSFDRVGSDVVIENAFGRGGTLHFDGELNSRKTELPDQADENESNFRVDRLSYSEGGTRFRPDRWEAGRFLQKGLPQFGILDGYEWSRRLEGGDRWGLSAGFKPEPNADMESGKDFQIAGYYRWVADETERVSAAAGYQKTWHNGVPDRDLLVLDAHLLPLDGWSYQGTMWVDFFSSGDDLEGSGLGLTQAYFSASRSWDDEQGVLVSYSRYSFPELNSNEFPPVTPEQLAEDANNRLNASGWKELDDLGRLHGSTGFWFDEDEKGGHLEGGLSVEDLLLDNTLADVTVFIADAQFEKLIGGRASYGVRDDDGSWDFSYELANHRLDGFASNFDDVVHHWVRVSRNYQWKSGWDLSISADLRTWTGDDSWSLGVYAQRNL